MKRWFGKISMLAAAAGWAVLTAVACGQEGNIVSGATTTGGTSTSGSTGSTSTSGSGGSGGGGATTTTGAGGTPEGCYDYTAFDSTTPTVSFQADVLPIFQKSCGLSSSCHGVENSAKEGQHYLGPKNGSTATQAQIDAIFAENVDVDSAKDPGMKVIAPGDPAHSFMLHKLDDTLACAFLACTDDDCGGSMPLGGDTKPAEERDTIRRWIAQGALNN